MTLPEFGLPSVIDEFTLSNSFLGNIVEVCFVTRDHQRTMEGLVRLGVGPFRVYTFTPDSVDDQTYQEQVSPFGLKVCFATNGNLTYEVMEPLSGRTVMQDFLDAHGEGIHHVAFDCNGSPWEERVTFFADRGFSQTQSGSWLGQNSFAFFGTEAATTTCFETYHFPDGFVYPPPERWYPGPPPGINTES